MLEGLTSYREPCAIYFLNYKFKEKEASTLSGDSSTGRRLESQGSRFPSWLHSPDGDLGALTSL